MEKKKIRKRRVIQIIRFFMMMLVGAVVGYFGGYAASRSGGMELWQIGMTLVWLCLGYFLQIIIHEAGHLVCGLLSGYRFVSFRIGSFMLAKYGRRIEIKRYSLAGTGGQCLMAPPDMADGFIPFKLYSFGGVLFNFLSAGLFLIVRELAQSGSLLSSFASVGIVLGIAIGLMNGLPLQLGGIDNDGKNIVSLGRNPESLRAFWIQLKVNAMQMEGIRLKDMPADWFELPADWPVENSICAGVAVMACDRVVDQMDFQRAAEMAEALIQEKNGLLPLYTNILMVELIFAEIVGQNRREVVDQRWTAQFKRFLKSMKASPGVIRLHYAYELLVKGDEAAAEKKQREFEKMAPSYPAAGGIEGEREIMDYVRRLANQQLRQKLEVMNG